MDADPLKPQPLELTNPFGSSFAIESTIHSIASAYGTCTGKCKNISATLKLVVSP